MSPFPGLKKMRATAVLRRPVPRYCTIFNGTRYYLSYFQLFYAHRHGLLGHMRVLIAGIDLQFPVHLLAELGLREHAKNGVLDHAVRPGGADTPDAHFHQTPAVAGEMPIELVLFLFSGKPNLGRVDDHHVVAGIQTRRVAGLILTLFDPRHFAHPPSTILLLS